MHSQYIQKVFPFCVKYCNLLMAGYIYFTTLFTYIFLLCFKNVKCDQIMPDDH